MTNCPVCGKEIEVPRMWATNWPYEGQPICNRTCNEVRYKIREAARQETWDVLVQEITSQLAVTETDAIGIINGFNKEHITPNIAIAIAAFHTAFGARPACPVDPFAVPIFKERVGSILTVRRDDGI